MNLWSWKSRTSGRSDDATLELSGKGADGKVATSTVTMRREDGAWRVAKESMKQGG